MLSFIFYFLSSFVLSQTVQSQPFLHDAFFQPLSIEDEVIIRRDVRDPNINIPFGLVAKIASFDDKIITIYWYEKNQKKIYHVASDQILKRKSKRNHFLKKQAKNKISQSCVGINGEKIETTDWKEMKISSILKAIKWIDDYIESDIKKLNDVGMINIFILANNLTNNTKDANIKSIGRNLGLKWFGLWQPNHADDITVKIKLTTELHKFGLQNKNKYHHYLTSLMNDLTKQSDTFFSVHEISTTEVQPILFALHLASSIEYLKNFYDHPYLKRESKEFKEVVRKILFDYSYQPFVDATDWGNTYAATHVDYTFNYFLGSKQDYSQFPFLYNYLEDIFPVLLKNNHFELISEVLSTFINLGLTPTESPVLCSGTKFLLDTQKNDGQWIDKNFLTYPNVDTDAYRLVHVPWMVIEGLREKDLTPKKYQTRGRKYLVDREDWKKILSLIQSERLADAFIFLK